MAMSGVKDCAGKCGRTLTAVSFDTAEWAKEEGMAQCKECRQGRCAACGYFKTQKFFGAKQWALSMAEGARAAGGSGGKCKRCQETRRSKSNKATGPARTGAGAGAGAVAATAVHKKTTKKSTVAGNRWACGECGEEFKTWIPCLTHLRQAKHMGLTEGAKVSTEFLFQDCKLLDAWGDDDVIEGFE